MCPHDPYQRAILTPSISIWACPSPITCEAPALSDRGVLFLDELPEFRRPVLEALRQPLEEGQVRVVRAHGSIAIGARFQLVAAMNPCPCGHRDDPLRECECDDAALRRYRGRLSGPLLDRIDLRVAVPSVPWEELVARRAGESTEQVRARVCAARERQSLRYRDQPHHTNAELPASAPQPALAIEPAVRRLLERAVRKLGLSARAYTRVLRVARTIADLDGDGPDDAPLGPAAVAEALGFRGA